ncbi:Ankyrin repeat protein [Giardia duodenalis assemblage B]|uniref:Ankyrin repeat protein n=1 Tax=Giardia duodenalis assemblage B TaxID=1394984 RepID=A0A132NXI5_GIAIN|nr:Ankyrin repeat protein [Giardia intestinalis assemblage B]
MQQLSIFMLYVQANRGDSRNPLQCINNYEKYRNSLKSPHPITDQFLHSISILIIL